MNDVTLAVLPLIDAQASAFTYLVDMLQTDIAIVGAGPAGAATALRLSYLGIPCTLIDKSSFPRDKICGDAISGKVSTLLDRLDPEIMKRFRSTCAPTDVWGIRFYAPNRNKIELPFSVDYVRDPDRAPGYVSKRIDFDQFLISEVRRRHNIDLRLETEIGKYERTEKGYLVRSVDGDLTLTCRLLIDASGAQSAFSRKVAGLKKENHHHAGAVRAYYEGVTGFHADNFIELHFVEAVNPGYFWIFPLPNGRANVGLGVRTDLLKRKKINMRAELERVIESPQFRDRFVNARPLDKTKGYGLPLGSKRRKLSGDHFLLIGDAGHLIDPLTGEGIGNGVYSGFIAAELAEKALSANRFDGQFLAAYDVRVDRVLRSEMRISYRLQRLMSVSWLANLGVDLVRKNPRLIRLLTRMYTDLELRKQLTNPLFWWRSLLEKRKKQKAHV